MHTYIYITCTYLRRCVRMDACRRCKQNTRYSWLMQQISICAALYRKKTNPINEEAEPTHHGPLTLHPTYIAIRR